METFQNYEGYGISYSSISGTTKVVDYGFTLKSFVGLGEHDGLISAKKYIDQLNEYDKNFLKK